MYGEAGVNMWNW